MQQQSKDRGLNAKELEEARKTAAPRAGQTETHWPTAAVADPVGRRVSIGLLQSTIPGAFAGHLKDQTISDQQWFYLLGAVEPLKA